MSYESEGGWGQLYVLKVPPGPPSLSLSLSIYGWNVPNEIIEKENHSQFSCIKADIILRTHLI
jgi:hypothetical protein